jgi:hypothetical protein
MGDSGESATVHEGAGQPEGAEEVSIDLRHTKVVPKWIEEVVAASYAMDHEDARSAGALGFMHRALVNTAMPYKDPKSRVFERRNGSFTLSILAGYDGGIPYGIYPRLLMSWVSTEVVRTQSPELELGESLAGFLREVLNVSSSGGKHGTGTRVAEQMKRLFGAQIVAVESGQPGRRPFKLRNMSVVNEVDLDEDDFERRLSAPSDGADDNPLAQPGGQRLWTPQRAHQSGWKSRVLLTEYFFEEILRGPVPIDLRAYRALRGSPLAMDIYAWLTYRMSYLQKPSKVIKWVVLMAQFGSSYSGERAVLDFKRNFLQALNAVLLAYPRAKVKVMDDGIVLHPSPSSVPKLTNQGTLPGF